MGNIVGKITFLCAIMCVVMPVYAGIAMRAIDDNDQAIKQIQIGVPFYLEVTIEDLDFAAPPEIKGLSTIHSRRAGYQMNSVNGSATSIYTHMVRIDEPGRYVLGPATTLVKGVVHSSNAIIMTVHADAASQKEKTHQKERAFLRFALSKQRAVVGECVPCTLTFYYDSVVRSVDDIVQQDMPDFDRKNMSETIRGTEVVDGKRYNYLRWTWDLYPQTVGEFVIPAHCVNFAMRAARKNRVRNWASFFGPSMQSKRVYSNAEKVIIDPLPDHPGHVFAVGEFDFVRAHISPAVAKQGEGMVLQLALYGKGDLENVQIPIVRGMPEQLKYYDSKAEIIPDDNDEGATKKYEFIVQGLQPGNFEIPKQSFVVFDTNARLYKTLETAPLLVTITPSNALAPTTVVRPPDEIKEESVAVAYHDQLAPLHETGPLRAHSHAKSLPLWIFALLAFLPFGWRMQGSITRMWHAWKTRMNPKTLHKKAFAIARKELKKAQKDNNVQALHAVFVRLIAHRTGKNALSISIESIADMLIGTDQEAWYAFINTVSGVSFGGQTLSQAQLKQLYAQAATWIQKLEDVL